MYLGPIRTDEHKRPFDGRLDEGERAMSGRYAGASAVRRVCHAHTDTPIDFALRNSITPLRICIQCVVQYLLSKAYLI